MAEFAHDLRRALIRAVPGRGQPRPFTPAQAWRLALANVEYWDDAVYQAHRAVIDSEPSRMLAAVDAWHATEDRLAAAHRRERRARLEANGRRWLKLVGGRDRG